MVARIQFDKGVQLYAEAAAILKKRHPEVLFALLGPRDRGPAGIEDSELMRWQQNGMECWKEQTSVALLCTRLHR